MMLIRLADFCAQRESWYNACSASDRAFISFALSLSLSSLGSAAFEARRIWLCPSGRSQRLCHSCQSGRDKCPGLVRWSRDRL
jgi:hypothetical protein